MSKVTVRPRYHILRGIAAIWMSAGAVTFLAIQGSIMLALLLAIVAVLLIVGLLTGKERRRHNYSLGELLLPWILMLSVPVVLVAVGSAYASVRPYLLSYLSVLVVLLVLAAAEIVRGFGSSS